MEPSRRNFAKVLGASVVAPALAPPGGLSLWERAEAEYQQAGEVSPDLVRALLDTQGSRGIYENPADFEELRKAIGRKLRDHRIIRSFPVPDGVEPLLSFRR